jgi:hypothetical protein
MTHITTPFTSCHLSVDGFQVPHITANPLAGPSDGLINLTLDHRFGITTDKEEIQKWMPFVAHAMAVASGYSCHGENSQIMNPHSVQLMSLDELPGH